MIYVKLLLMILIGLSSGSVIAAGVFAFITAVDVITRLASRTRTAEKIYIYENCIIAGGIFGNLLDFYHFPLPGGFLLGGIFALASGVFVGCLVMSLSETLDVIPTVSRRIHLSVGIQYVILGVAFGKVAGAMTYFFRGWWH